MKIIRANKRHINQVATLFDAYRKFYQQAPNLQKATDFIHERITRSESVVFLALTSEGKPIGFTQLYPSFTSVGMKRLWILNHLFIHPDFRKQGVGEALMNKAKDWATAKAAKRLFLQTAVDNTQAQQLYERLGYIQDTHSYYYELEL